MNTVNTDNKELKQKNVKLERECDALKHQVNSVETYSRKNNIVFYGITEDQHETNDQCLAAVRNFMIKNLSIPLDKANTIVVMRCHCLKQRGRNRPIIVRFNDYHDREYIWDQLSKIPKYSGFFISEDFPKSVSFNRKKMLPIFHKARKSLEKSETSLKGDVLTVSGSGYTTNKMHARRCA